MKQKFLFGVASTLLFCGVATACQHHAAAMTAQPTLVSLKTDGLTRLAASSKEEVIDTREYKVGAFDKIDCSTIASIHFTQGSNTSVVAKLRAGSLDLLSVSCEDGCLKIETEEGKWAGNRFSIDPKNKTYVGDLDGEHSPQQQVDLYITAPTLEKITMSGVSSFTAQQLNVPKLKVNLSGVCTMKLPQFYCDDTEINLSGVCNINANIKGKLLDVNNSGVGTTDLIFKGVKADIDNSGMGTMKVEVDCQQLHASNSGAAKMTLKGTADQTDINNSGVSKINTKELNKY